MGSTNRELEAGGDGTEEKAVSGSSFLKLVWKKKEMEMEEKEDGLQRGDSKNCHYQQGRCRERHDMKEQFQGGKGRETEFQTLNVSYNSRQLSEKKLYRT